MEEDTVPLQIHRPHSKVIKHNTAYFRVIIHLRIHDRILLLPVDLPKSHTGPSTFNRLACTNILGRWHIKGKDEAFHVLHSTAMLHRLFKVPAG